MFLFFCFVAVLATCVQGHQHAVNWAAAAGTRLVRRHGAEIEADYVHNYFGTSTTYTTAEQRFYYEHLQSFSHQHHDLSGRSHENTREYRVGQTHTGGSRTMKMGCCGPYRSTSSSYEDALAQCHQEAVESRAAVLSRHRSHNRLLLRRPNPPVSAADKIASAPHDLSTPVPPCMAHLGDCSCSELLDPSVPKTCPSTYTVGAAESSEHPTSDIKHNHNGRLSSALQLPEYSTERSALMALYNATNNPTIRWLNTTGWGTTAHYCTWHGVACDHLGSVCVLSLLNNQLSGHVPSELVHLSRLRFLQLDVNAVLSLPSNMGSLTTLISLSVQSTRVTALPESLRGSLQLQQMCVTHCPIRTLPSWLGSLSSMLDLSLAHTPVTSLPSSIGNMTRLQLLSVQFTRLSALPTEIGNLRLLGSLESYEISTLKSLPAQIGMLRNLLFLRIFNTPIRALPTQIGMLSRLVILVAFSMQLTAVPSELALLTSLTVLDLGSNPLLSALPSQLSQLSSLCQLDLFVTAVQELPPFEYAFQEHCIAEGSGASLNLQRTQITQLPKTLATWTGLTQLNAVSMPLQRLPTQIGYLSRLQKLAIWNTPLSQLPTQIGLLTSLTSLDISFTRISTMPSELGSLSRLLILTLDGSRVTSLPTTVQGMSSLWWLSAQQTPLSSVPSELASCPSLLHVYFTGCPVASLPSELFRMTALQQLWLDKTDISALPHNISLPNLMLMDLSGTRVSMLPYALATLPRLSWIRADNARVTSLYIPTELCTAPQLELLTFRNTPLLSGFPACQSHANVQIDDATVRSEGHPVRRRHSDNTDGDGAGSGGAWAALEYLDVSNCSLSQLSLPPLNSLDALLASSNSLTGVPAYLCHMTYLSRLEMAGNNINALPACLNSVSFPRLFVLDLSHNPLSLQNVPQWLQLPSHDVPALLPALQYLSLGYTHMNDWPKGLFLHAPILRMLDLSGTRIQLRGSGFGVCDNVAVAAAVLGRSRIADLRLTDNDINDSLRDVLSCLRFISTLQALHLQNNFIFMRAPLYLNAPNWNIEGGPFPSLQYLNLSNNMLGRRASFASSSLYLPQVYMAISGALASVDFSHDSSIVFSGSMLPWMFSDTSTMQQDPDTGLLCPERTGKYTVVTHTVHYLRYSVPNPPPVFSLSEGVIGYSQCRCLEGYFFNPVVAQCWRCSTNMYCHSNASEAMQVYFKEGWYALHRSIGVPLASPQDARAENIVYLPCRLAALCNPELTAEQREELVVRRVRQDLYCATGRDVTSLLCSRCEVDHFDWGVSCLSCPSSPVLVIVCNSLLLVIGLTWLWRRSWNSRDASLTIVLVFLQLLHILEQYTHAVLSSASANPSQTRVPLLSSLLQEVATLQPWALQCVHAEWNTIVAFYLGLSATCVFFIGAWLPFLSGLTAFACPGCRCGCPCTPAGRPSGVAHHSTALLQDFGDEEQMEVGDEQAVEEAEEEEVEDGGGGSMRFAMRMSTAAAVSAAAIPRDDQRGHPGIEKKEEEEEEVDHKVNSALKGKDKAIPSCSPEVLADGGGSLVLFVNRTDRHIGSLDAADRSHHHRRHAEAAAAADTKEAVVPVSLMTKISRISWWSLQILYLPMLVRSLQILNCEEHADVLVNGQPLSFVSSLPYLSCHSHAYTKLRIASIAVLVCLAPLPLWLAMLLFLHHRRAQSQGADITGGSSASSSSSFLNVRLTTAQIEVLSFQWSLLRHPSLWYWTVVLVNARKLCIAILVASLPFGSGYTPLGVAFVIGGSLLLQVQVHPYRTRLENSLEVMTLSFALFCYLGRILVVNCGQSYEVGGLETMLDLSTVGMSVFVVLLLVPLRIRRWCTQTASRK